MLPRVGRPASPTPWLLLVAAGLPNGLGYGVLAGSVSIQVPRLLDAALARLPATMVVAAVAVLLFGPPLQWPIGMMDIAVHPDPQAARPSRQAAEHDTVQPPK